MLFFLSIQKSFGFFAFKWKVVCKCNHFVLNCQKFVFLLRVLSFGTFRNYFAELTFGNQIFDNIQTSDKVAICIQLWVCGPVLVGSEPVSHQLIFDDIVECELNLVILENLKQCSCESAFWIFWSTFNENNDRAAWKDGLNFREPDLLICVILFSVLLNLGWQLIKDQTQIFRLFVSLEDFFISLSDNNCGSCLNSELIKSLRAFRSLEAVVNNMLVCAEDADRVWEVIEELFGFGVCLRVENKDDNWAKISEKVSQELLIRFECDDFVLDLHGQKYICWLSMKIS